MDTRIENREAFTVWGYQWEVLFEKELPSVGYKYIDAGKCFELFGSSGEREIWVPVVNADV